MKPNMFCIGPSLPCKIRAAFTHSHTIIHSPLIKLTPLFHPKKLDQIVQKKNYYGLILTSSFPIIYIDRLLMFTKKRPSHYHIFCVGKVTMNRAKKYLSSYSHQLTFHTALEENQEGLFKYIYEKMKPEYGPLIWLSSTHARKNLQELLKQHTFQCDIIPIYQPMSIYRTIRWKEEDTICCTCSSSVHAFFSFFRNQVLKMPPSFLAIGEQTLNILKIYIKSPLLFSSIEK